MDKMNRTMWVLGGAIAVVLIAIIVIAGIKIVNDQKAVGAGSETTQASETSQEEVTTQAQTTEESTEAATTEEETTTEETTTEEVTTEAVEETTEATEESIAMNLVYSADFEDSVVDFVARGPELIALSEDCYEGSYSMSVTGRQKSWNGPKVSMDNYLVAGESYYVSTFVKFMSESDTSDMLQISLQYNDAEGTERYQTIANVTCKVGEWVSLGDYFAVPADASGTLFLYIETNGSANMNDIYVDNFIVGQKAE